MLGTYRRRHLPSEDGVGVPDTGAPYFASRRRPPHGGTDPTGAVLITPGSSEQSSVYTLWTEGLMPKLGVQVPDSASLARLKAWIDALVG